MESWDDPRFPTVAGILRRGMTIDGLKTFILSMGASKNTNLMEWDKIWAMNKAMIDPIAPRHVIPILPICDTPFSPYITEFVLLNLTPRMTALLTDGLVPCVLEGAPPDEFMRSVHAHPKDESIGKKIKFYAPTVYLQADDPLPCRDPSPTPPPNTPINPHLTPPHKSPPLPLPSITH